VTRPTRRALLKSGLAGVAALNSNLLWSQEEPPIKRNGRIHQSVCRWCYNDISTDKLSAYAAHIGLSGVDLLKPDEYEIPRHYGLVCTMALIPGVEIPDGYNRVENHAALEAGLRKYLPIAAKAGIKRTITVSGNRRGMSDEEGLKNTILGLNRVKKIGEDNGIIICMELLNSKVNHHDYMCDHTDWGVRAVQEVNSPNVKLVYDIYHMQIMEGDLIATIQQNIQWISHFHTGGVPGRHELNNKQEVCWDGVMRGIAATGFDGYVAHEFLPTQDPYVSLRQAADLCDV
jgi:hydroxypyruvate isomerase